jgi:putative tryptophan/tyrosine transport system substrate-binding protein
MDRRTFVTLIPCALLAAVHPVLAQQKPIPRIGYLRFIEFPPNDEAFRRGLRELGYVEGQNIRIEYRQAGGNVERVRELADELVSLKVDVLVAASTQAVDAAKRATNTIPIVFPVTFDPVESGFVASLARPGGNLTGLSPINPVVTAKRVELLREVIPHISRVAVLRNPTNSGSLFALRETEAAAKRLGIRPQIFEVRTVNEVEAAFRAAVEDHADAVMVLSDNFFFSQQDHIIDLGKRHRLPEMFDTGDFVKRGGLISYGANLADLYQRSAAYVDKILKGASPANLPVEQATKFELFVNLKTAKVLGLTIHQSVLLRADEVIQ